MALSLRASSSRIFYAHASKSRILCRALSTSEPTLPSHADIVVVGGGIIGTSVAYHLAKLGTAEPVKHSKMLSGLNEDFCVVCSHQCHTDRIQTQVKANEKSFCWNAIN